jgi:RNA polymerase sigma-70 factor (ECF subfamily)
MSIQQEKGVQNGSSTIKAQDFRKLHEQFQGRLLNSMTAFVRNREAAEDITAAAFSAAFANRHHFRGESSFYTWLHAIALNEARNRSRNGSVVVESIDGPRAKELSEPDVLPQMLERSECALRIRKALRAVPAIYRRILIDHFVRGYPVKQISQRDRIPVGTVLSRIFTGKRLLRGAWETAT